MSDLKKALCKCLRHTIFPGSLYVCSKLLWSELNVCAHPPTHSITQIPMLKLNIQDDSIRRWRPLGVKS